MGQGPQPGRLRTSPSFRPRVARLLPPVVPPLHFRRAGPRWSHRIALLPPGLLVGRCCPLLLAEPTRDPPHAQADLLRSGQRVCTGCEALHRGPGGTRRMCHTPIRGATPLWSTCLPVHRQPWASSWGGASPWEAVPSSSSSRRVASCREKAHAKTATLQGASRRGSAGHPRAPRLPPIPASAASQGPPSLGLRFDGVGGWRGREESGSGKVGCPQGLEG